jgi:hypothetical protein
MDDRPWGEIGGPNRKLTQRRLSDLLRPFKIKPRSDGRQHCYYYEDFIDTFERYLNIEIAPAAPKRKKATVK